MKSKSLKRTLFIRFCSFLIGVFLLLTLTLPTIGKTASLGLFSGGQGFSAKFAGIDMTEANSEFVTNITDAALASRNLSIVAPFSDGGTDKRLEITLAHGVGFVSLPGMVKSGNSWVWNPEVSKLPEQLIGRLVSAEYIPAETTVNGHDFSNAKYVPRAGKIVYTVSDGTTGVTLDLPLTMDTAFANTPDQMSIDDAIKVSVIDNGAETNNAVLDKYTVLGEVRMRPSFGSKRYTVAQGATFNHYVYLSTFIVNQNLAMHATHRIFEEYSVTFRVPKGVTFTGTVEPYVNSTLKQEDIKSISTDTSSPTINTLTVVIKTANMVTASLDLGMKVDSDAPISGFYNVLVAGQTVETVYGQTTFSTAYSDGSVITVASADPDTDLALEPLVANEVHVDDWDSDASNLLLGGFRMSNYTLFDYAGRKLTLDFSNPSLGVKALRLWVGSEGASDISVVTTKNRTLTPANIAGTASGDSGYVATLNMYSQLASDEYIKTISYNMGTIKSGAYTTTGMYNVGSTFVAYFGELLGTPKAYQAVATLEKPDGSGGYVEVKNHIQKISANGLAGNHVVNYISSTAPANPAATPLMGGGASKEISVSFSLHQHRYSVNQFRSATGFTVYLRQPKDLSVSNISATYAGKTYKAEGPYTDTSGTPYYKIVLNDAVLGYYDEEMKAYSSIKVTASFAANASAPTFSINLNDIVFIAQNDAYPSTTGGYGTSASTDKYDFNNKIPLGSVPDTSQLMITGQQAFNVATAASRDEVSWAQYNPAAQTGKISLNTKQDAFYQVSVNNNSGAAITTGYTVMVPIPKAGESFVSPYMGEEYTFNWPASLAGEISSSIDGTKTSNVAYTVHYATTYAALQDQASAEWSTTIPDDLDSIRAVKISTAQSLPDKFVDSFHFPLKLPQDSVAVQYSGEENIYPAVVYASAGGSAGYTDSQPVCLVLNTGIATGKALIDENHDGVGEKPLAGITVKAFETGADIATATPIETTVTGVDGSYQFVALSIEQNVDIVFSGWNANSYKVESPANAIYKDITPSSAGSSGLDLMLIPPFEVNFMWVGTLPPSPPQVSDQEIFKGDKATQPVGVDVVGYTFDGWYTNSSATGTKFDFATTTITADMTLYAKYTLNEYTITYVDPLGVEHTYTTSYTINTTPINLPDLSAYGYTFNGWYTDSGCVGSASTAVNPATSMNNLTFYAKWGTSGTGILADPDVYTISYSYDGGAMASGVSNPVSYTVLDLPITIKAPVKKGNSFTGWNGTAAGSGDFALSISSGTAPNTINDGEGIFGNISLTANWAINPYTLSFELNGNAKFPTNPSSIDDVQVDFDTFISSAPGYITTEREGWLFGGWFMDSALELPVGTSKMPSSQTTIYAKWTQQSYSLNFDTIGQGSVAEQLLSFKDLAQKPTDPEKEGYEFEGWFDAETGGAKWDFDVDTMPSQNQILYAQYSIMSYDITYKYSYTEQEDVVITVQFGELLQEPQSPNRDGHTFIGWADEENNLWLFDSNTVPAKDVTLTTVWEINTYTVEFFDDDGNLLKTETVDWNKNATPPSDPKRDGYTFVGWVGNYDSVIKDETVTAEFVENETVTTSTATATSTSATSTSNPTNTSSSSSNTTKTTDENGTAPETGENNGLLVIIMLCSLLAFGVTIAVFIVKKQKFLKR